MVAGGSIKLRRLRGRLRDVPNLLAAILHNVYGDRERPAGSRSVLTYRLSGKVSSQIFTVPREITPGPAAFHRGRVCLRASHSDGGRVKARYETVAETRPPTLIRNCEAK